MLVVKFFKREDVLTISDALSHYASLEKQRSNDFFDDEQMRDWSAKEVKRILSLRDYFRKKVV